MKSSTKNLTMTAFLAVFVFTGLNAYAQDAETVNRIQRLENEIETLNRAVYGAQGVQGRGSSAFGQNNSASLVETQIENQQLEIEVRELRGQVEEQSFEIRQLKDQLERLNNDLSARFEMLERGGVQTDIRQQPQSPVFTQNSETSGSQALPDNTLGTLTQSPEGDVVDSSRPLTSQEIAMQAYEDAFAKVRQENYDEAQIAFDSFLKSYPDHELAGNAKYWLGETYYVRNNFKQAARVFAEGYQKYPQGQKAPDNLLKLGLSLAGMGQANDACVALAQLEKDEYQNAGPVIARARQEKQRLGCS